MLSRPKAALATALSIAVLAFQLAPASPTGLNVIPTTDLVPLYNSVFGLQNGNTAFSRPAFWQAPGFVYQSQFGLDNWCEAGIDAIQTPDLRHYAAVFNAKFLLHQEDYTMPNLAVGIFNVTQGQNPSYYVTLSKTLNYAQEQEERFRAHHRRNRKLLGRRLHVGAMTDNLGVIHPFLGTDMQLNESAVFQSDWVQGHGNGLSAGIAYVMPDQRTVINPAFLFSNDTHQFGLQLNISRQFPF